MLQPSLASSRAAIGKADVGEKYGGGCAVLGGASQQVGEGIEALVTRQAALGVVVQDGVHGSVANNAITQLYRLHTDVLQLLQFLVISLLLCKLLAELDDVLSAGGVSEVRHLYQLTLGWRHSVVLKDSHARVACAGGGIAVVVRGGGGGSRGCGGS